MSLKVTTLVENSSSIFPLNLQGEHGISLYIEFDKQKILFDTGQTNLFFKNANILKIDLSDVQHTVISHGHYDHAGGLNKFLEVNQVSKIICQEKIATQNQFKKTDSLQKFIGISGDFFETSKERFTFFKEEFFITDNIYCCINKTFSNKSPIGNKQMFLLKNNNFIRDAFIHEIILTIIEKNNVHIFTGCSHNGIINMIETVNKKFPDKKIKTLIGGFHLIGEKDEAVIDIATKLKNKNIGMIYTGHCTGEKAFHILKGILNEKIDKFYTGKIITG